MKEFLYFIALATGLIVAAFIFIFFVLSLVVVLISPFMYYQCKNYSAVTGTQTKYSFTQQRCFLKMQDKWIPYEKWVNISGEIK